MEPLALYIHWPFCAAKCPYCDFNSHVRDRVDEARFRAALRRELAHEAALIGRRPLASIFFGGGTPSLMAPETVAALIEDAARFFNPLPDIEILTLCRFGIGEQALIFGMLQQPVTCDCFKRSQWRISLSFLPGVTEKSSDFFSAWIKHHDRLCRCFLRNSHKSRITQFQHCGVRARQVYRPCSISQ